MKKNIKQFLLIIFGIIMYILCTFAANGTKSKTPSDGVLPGPGNETSANAETSTTEIDKNAEAEEGGTTANTEYDETETDTPDPVDYKDVDEEVIRGHWETIAEGSQWIDEDGGTLICGWHWLDPDDDGFEERYYINSDGCKEVDTITPDGYIVDKDGKWISNGVIQEKFIPRPGRDIDNEEIKKRISTASQAYVFAPETIETAVYEDNASKFEILYDKLVEEDYDRDELDKCKTILELNEYVARVQKEEEEREIAEALALAAEEESEVISKSNEIIFDKEWLKMYNEKMRERKLREEEDE